MAKATARLSTKTHTRERTNGKPVSPTPQGDSVIQALGRRYDEIRALEKIMLDGGIEADDAVHDILSPVTMSILEAPILSVADLKVKARVVANEAYDTDAFKNWKEGQFDWEDRCMVNLLRAIAAMTEGGRA